MKVNEVVSVYDSTLLQFSHTHTHTHTHNTYVQVDNVVSQTNFESAAGSQNSAERIIQYTRIPINATDCPGNRIV